MQYHGLICSHKSEAFFRGRWQGIGAEKYSGKALVGSCPYILSRMENDIGRSHAQKMQGRIQDFRKGGGGACNC